MTINLFGWMHGNIELIADKDNYDRYTGAHRLIERLVENGTPRDLATATAKVQYGHPRVAVFIADDSWDGIPAKQHCFTGSTSFLRIMLGETSVTPLYIPLPYSIYDIAEGTSDLSWLMSTPEIFRIFGCKTPQEVHDHYESVVRPEPEPISLIG